MALLWREGLLSRASFNTTPPATRFPVSTLSSGMTLTHYLFPALLRAIRIQISDLVADSTSIFLDLVDSNTDTGLQLYFFNPMTDAGGSDPGDSPVDRRQSRRFGMLSLAATSSWPSRFVPSLCRK